MPELPDVEGFRREFERRAAGKRVGAVRGVDESMLRNTTARSLSRSLKGRRFGSPRRHGKLLICPVGQSALVLHFGMTGLLAWCADEPRHPHDRLTLVFRDGELRYRNMRKFGGVWLTRDEAELGRLCARLGPDWLAVSRDDFERLIDLRRGSIKAMLMNQSVAAGLGNLTADEALWQARIDPSRPPSSLSRDERRTLYTKIRKVLRDSIPYGLVPAKRTWLTGARDRRDGICPRCGAPLERRKLAGRTTVFCSREQR